MRFILGICVLALCGCQVSTTSETEKDSMPAIAVYKYSLRLRKFVGVDAQHKAVFGDIQGDQLWVPVRVVECREAEGKSPSIAVEDDLVMFELAGEETIPNRPLAQRIELWYDRHALFPPMQFADQSLWKLGFDGNGNLIDIDGADARGQQGETKKVESE